jgi:hypothetical protein
MAAGETYDVDFKHTTPLAGRTYGTEFTHGSTLAR